MKILEVFFIKLISISVLNLRTGVFSKLKVFKTHLGIFINRPFVFILVPENFGFVFHAKFK